MYNNRYTGRIDLTGKKFGRLTVLKALPKVNFMYYWEVQCDCGTIKKVDGKALRGGFTESCGCLRIEANRKRRQKRPFESLYNIFVSRAKYKVELTYEDFLEYTKINCCYYCGAEIVWVPYYKFFKYNLDRKDSNKTYTKENCVVCCARCNFGKSNRFTSEEWLIMTKALKEYQTKCKS